MVFGADWDEPLSPEDMKGRAFTVEELRMSHTLDDPNAEPRRDVLSIARLFDPATGKRVEVRETFKDYDYDAADFMWTEGNYACDCNRRLFMARALGAEEPKDPNNPCGNSIVLEKLELVE